MLQLTNGRGVDRIVEIGGPNTFEQSLRAISIRGQISVVGFSAGVGGKIDPTSLLGRDLTLRSMVVGSRDDYEALMRAIDVHKVVPVVDRVFAFNEVPEAFAYFAGKQFFGKLVVRCQ